MTVPAKLKLPLILIAGLLVLAGLATAILPSLADTDGIRSRMEDSLMRHTGAQFASDSISVSLLSGSVTFRNPSLLSSARRTIMQADELVIVTGLSELFSENPAISDVILNHARINLSAEEQSLWSSGGTSGGFSLPPLTIRNAALSFRHDGKERSISNINGSLMLSDSQLFADLSATMESHPLSLSANCQLQDMFNSSAFRSDCKADAQVAATALQYQGLLTHTDQGWQGKYTLNADTADLRTAADLLLADGESQWRSLFASALPLRMESTHYLTPEQFIADMPVLESGNSSGKGRITRSYRPEDTQILLSLARLDVAELLPSLRASLNGETSVFTLKKGFNRKLRGGFSLQAGEVILPHGKLTNAAVKASMSQGTISLTEGSAAIGPNAQLTVLGTLSATGFGLRFDGLSEAAGTSAEGLFALAGMTADEELLSQFSTFRSRFNLIVDPRSVVISELRLLTEEGVQLAGGLVADTQGDAPDVRASLSLNNMDWTPLEKRWLPSPSLLEMPSADHPYQFAWLNGLRGSWQVSVALQNNLLFGQPLQQFSSTLSLSADRMKLDDLAMRYGGEQAGGMLTITRERSAARPFIDGKLRVSSLRFGDSFRDYIWAEEGKTDFSEKQISLAPLHYADGRLLLQVGSISHALLNLNNVSAELSLQNQVLNINKLKAGLWNGQFEGDVSLSSGAVPGLSLQGQVAGASTQAFTRNFVPWDNFNGRFNSSGRLQMSGVSFRNWMETLRGGVSYEFRNLLATPFNLPLVVRSIQAARSVSALQNIMRSAFDRGTARIASIRGGLSIENGIAQIPETTLRSNEAVGMLTGKLNLLQWEADVVAALGLIQLQPTNPPDLLLIFSDNLDAPVLQTDARDLESWVARQ